MDVVQGPFLHGEQDRSILYKSDATEVVHDRAAVNRLTAVRAAPPLPPTETPVQPAQVLPCKGVLQLQSTLRALTCIQTCKGACCEARCSQLVYPYR